VSSPSIQSLTVDDTDDNQGQTVSVEDAGSCTEVDTVSVEDTADIQEATSGEDIGDVQNERPPLETQPSD
jgi:hypothetical protein